MFTVHECIVRFEVKEFENEVMGSYRLIQFDIMVIDTHGQ